MQAITPTKTYLKILHSRKAYLQKVIAAHPDKGGTSEEFKELKDAYLDLQRRSPASEQPQPSIGLQYEIPLGLNEAQYTSLQCKAAAVAFSAALAALWAGKAVMPIPIFCIEILAAMRAGLVDEKQVLSALSMASDEGCLLQVQLKRLTIYSLMLSGISDGCRSNIAVMGNCYERHRMRTEA